MNAASEGQPPAQAGTAEVKAKSRLRSIGFGALRLSIGVALMTVLVRTGVLDFRALGGLVEGWPFTVAAVVVIALAICATAVRLCILLWPRGFDLSLAASTKLTLIGVFFNSVMPGSSGGDLVRIYYAAKGNEGRRAEIVAILLLDRFIGLVALLMYPVLLVPLYFSLLLDNPALRAVIASSAGLIVLLAVGAWVFVSRETGREAFGRLLRRLPGGDVIRRMAITIRSYEGDRRPIWKALGVSLVAHAMGVGGFVILARAVAMSGFEWMLFVVVPIGMVVNTIPLTPGGLGVGEAAFAVLFGMAGLTGGPEVLLSWRVVTICVGLIGLPLYLQGRQQFVSARELMTDPVANPRPTVGTDAATGLDDPSPASARP